MALAHYTVGSGPHSTVLLHGYLGSGRNLKTLAQRWSERQPSRTLLVPDLTGHGDSKGLPEGAGLSDLAADTLATARAAGLAFPLSFAGHSMGGRVSLVAARLEPSSVREVALIDIAPGPIPPEVAGTERVLEALVAAPDTFEARAAARAFFVERRIAPAVADWLLTNLVRREGEALLHWRVDRLGLQRLQGPALREDLWPVVEAGRVPVRALRGGRSPYVNDEDAARMERAGCKVTTLEGVGHFVHLEALAPLVDFLSRGS